MRIITHRPDTTIPELVEKDIERNLIIACIQNFNRCLSIAVAIQYFDSYSDKIVFNWYGNDSINKPLYKWGHERAHNICTLLQFIIKSWIWWCNSNPIMYVCESREDISEVCNTIGITNPKLVTELNGLLTCVRSVYSASPAASDPN